MNKEIITNMKEELQKLFTEELTLNKLNDLKVEYLGKSGKITELSKMMKDIPNEEKKDFGMLLNELRTEFNNVDEKTRTALETA